jgi:hypothetical protein
MLLSMGMEVFIVKYYVYVCPMKNNCVRVIASVFLKHILWFFFEMNELCNFQ